jgi:hypothetical protein
LGFIIKLININHNKYPSFCKILSQKWWWTKLWIKILLKQWGETKCTPKCALKIFPKITHTHTELVMTYDAVFLLASGANFSIPLGWATLLQLGRKQKKTWVSSAFFTGYSYIAKNLY